MNEAHDPSPHEDRVLEILKVGRDAGDPWGFATPSRDAAYHDIPRQRVNEVIDRLAAAGWIEQETMMSATIRDLYRFGGDPRESGDHDD